MYALSVEQRIAERLKKIDLTADNFSALTRDFGKYVSVPRMSQALRGAKDFDNDTGKFLLELLTRIEELTQASFPLPLSMKNPSVISRLLREMRETPHGLPSLQDLILLNAILQGQDLAEISMGRNISIPDLREQIAGISMKLTRASRQVTELMKKEASSVGPSR